ncbi:DUF805 domain-containing protein (plasmid) [Lactococcus garvieae]|uniref:DUF805 domain-containing protein n=1 Tax=Lactococcus garvieae TaxID=1363 RepID=UPI0030CD3F0F
MINAYKKFWTGYVDFESRTTRSEWWWVYLCQSIIGSVLGLFLILSLSKYILVSERGMGTPEVSPLTIIVGGILVLYSLATLVPSIAINVRRLRDAGFRWTFFFLMLIPYVGAITVFVLLQMPTKKI